MMPQDSFGVVKYETMTCLHKRHDCIYYANNTKIIWNESQKWQIYYD